MVVQLPDGHLIEIVVIKLMPLELEQSLILKTQRTSVVIGRAEGEMAYQFLYFFVVDNDAVVHQLFVESVAKNLVDVF